MKFFVRPHCRARLFLPLLAGLALPVVSSAFAATPTELLQRAEEHDRWTRDHMMPAGGIMGALFTDATKSDVALYVGRRDPAIWTGAYLAAQALRLMQTGDSDAAEQVASTVSTLHTWWQIAGDAGYLARFAAPEDSDPTILATLPASDPEVIRNVSYNNALWRWRGRVSRDQYQGVLLGMSLAYEATSDEEIRQLIREDVTAFAEQLMREETKRVRISIDGGPRFDVSLRLQHTVYTDDETPDGLPLLDVSTSPLDADASGILTFTPNPSAALQKT